MRTLAKGQMSNAESPWLPGATEPMLEASMEKRQDGIQQQQHVFWAPALCLCGRPALREQPSPMGSPSPTAILASTTQMSLSAPLPYGTSTPASSLVLPLSCLSEAEGLAGALIPSLSAAAAAVKINTERLVPRPRGKRRKVTEEAFCGKNTGQAEQLSGMNP